MQDALDGQRTGKSVFHCRLLSNSPPVTPRHRSRLHGVFPWPVGSAGHFRRLAVWPESTSPTALLSKSSTLLLLPASEGARVLAPNPTLASTKPTSRPGAPATKAATITVLESPSRALLHSPEEFPFYCYLTSAVPSLPEVTALSLRAGCSFTGVVLPSGTSLCLSVCVLTCRREPIMGTVPGPGAHS